MSDDHQTAGDGRVQPGDINSVWNKVAESYSAQDFTRPSYRAFFEVLLAATGDPAGRSYCEVGCGSGTTSALLARMGAEVSLVDIAPNALEFARQHFDHLGLQATYLLQDALAMDLADCSFDVVWNSGVIEHFYDPGKVQLIREMWRITGRGGYLFIAVPHLWDVPFLIAKKLAQWRGRWPYGYEDDLSIGRFDALAREAGLEHHEIFAYNPIQGWQFLPKGRRITQLMGLDVAAKHIRRTRWGHWLCLCVRKPEADDR